MDTRDDAWLENEFSGLTDAQLVKLHDRSFPSYAHLVRRELNRRKRTRPVRPLHEGPHTKGDER